MGPEARKVQRCCARSLAQPSARSGLRHLIIPQDQRDQSYSTVKTTSTAVTVNNLKPGTLYIFQIRTSSSPDDGSYNPSIEVETLAERKCWQARRRAQAPADTAFLGLSRGGAAARRSGPRRSRFRGAASVPLPLRVSELVLPRTCF